ncbi:hypothetical protein E1B28_012033 [Marasmius oreades]|uniref:Uncharacterized protein n=1 Tax=Marasmius oreades TaxID=181124 RepID=A0A9P7UQC9_9AGAR|nr:uncharacterized protein E1B28_012033 [Marasmius oreades]KAG7087994.1 hypothetical protein E1B28_012033 [Marasmius oreades]
MHIRTCSRVLDIMHQTLYRDDRPHVPRTTFQQPLSCPITTASYCNVDSFKMFKKASHLNFGTANLSIVHGNQNVNTYYLQHAHQVPGPGEEEWKVKLYQEYDRFPAGRIKILKTFTENPVLRREYEDDPENLSWREGRERSRAKRTAHLACLVQGVKESLPLLSIIYTGPDAQKVFKRDCLRYSRNRYANVVQLRGFNDSDIPMVLFHEELIPVQHIQRHHQFSTALQCYLSFQASIAKKNLPEWCPTQRNSYHWYNVWIQPRNGRVSFGPEGPWPGYFYVDDHSDWQLESCSDNPVLHPATYSADCITEYLIKYCPDHIFLEIFASTGTSSDMDLKIERCPRHTCQVWTRSSGRPFARFQARWKRKVEYPIFSEDLDPITMEDGRRRFSINSTTRLRQGEFLCWFEYEMDMPRRQQYLVWLSQACSIFSTLNIPKHEWADYELMHSIDLNLRLGTFDSEVKDSFDLIAPKIDNHQTDYCYLFLHPPPHFLDGSPDIHAWRSRKDFYYYSQDPDGKSVMAEYQLLSFRIPSIVPSVLVSTHSWDADVYDLISVWQERKGSDPTTTDFARMEVIYSGVDDWHFEDLSEDMDSTSYTDSVVTGDDGSMDVDSPTPYSHLQPGISSVFEDVEMMADVSFSTDTGMEVD